MTKKTLIILFWCIAILASYAQLPDPAEFCSHAQAHRPAKGATTINYQQYDTYDVNFYHLNLNAESNSTFISGEVLIRAKATHQALDTLVLELSNIFDIDRITLNGESISYLHQNDQIWVFFPEEIAEDKLFEVKMKYEGTAVSSNGRGFNSVNSNHGTWISYTLSEPFYSKDWWPCKQDLEDKADSVWVFVSTSKGNKVGSNGLLVHTEELENDKVRYEWKSKYPIAYYLISIAIAEYMEYSFVIENKDGNQVFMQNYLYPDSVMYKTQKALIDCTRLQMNLLQEKYGTYPFIDEKYGHSIAPLGGGMEHQTMTTQNSFAFHLTIHEMGHSWFGNQVTCARWNDIWINEGFATYTQYLGLQYLADESMADGFMAAMQSVVMREADGSVYVPDEFIEDRSRIFSSRLSYYKGAVIIHMIRYLVGQDDLFFSILREFQARFKDKTATGEDFRAVLEELSGQDFKEFFELWYYGEGYPIYDFQWQQNVNNELKISSSQQSSTNKTPFFPIQFDIRLFFEDGSQELLSVEQDQKENEFIIKLDKRLKNILPNPRSQNLMKIQSVIQGILEPSEIRLEPNPAIEKCVIRFGNYQPHRIIKIFDAEQKLIIELKAEQLTQILDLSSMASGVYFIQILDGDTSVCKKLVRY